MGLKIAFCSPEVFPFAKVGGLGDVCGTLPMALEHVGHEVFVFLPLYKSIDRKRGKLKRLENGIYTAFLGKSVEVFFVEEERFFGREGIYGEGEKDYSDSLQRFDYFCRQTFEMMRLLDIRPDVIHCHEWPTALIPVLLKQVYRKNPFFSKACSVLSIHNMAFQGVFPKESFETLDLEKKLYKELFEFYGQMNLLKAGILSADAVTTVSRGYADEILTKQFGCGLDDVVQKRKTAFAGILNGIDYSVWNPETDDLIDCKYGQDEFELKAVNKIAIQKRCRLPADPDIPLFGFVGRLTHQKGVDLLIESFELAGDLNFQTVILGTGVGEYHQQLRALAAKHPGRLAVFLEFNERLAHQIYAGIDFFLMPSRFEPCGLSQMISLKYSTVPLVYKTGGLADTIQPWDEGGNGLVFENYTAEALISKIREAVQLFKNKKEFEQLQKRAVRCDFSWDDSARQYSGVYNQCLEG